MFKQFKNSKKRKLMSKMDQRRGFLFLESFDEGSFVRH